MISPSKKAQEIYSKFFISTPQPYYVETANGGVLELKFEIWDKNWTVVMAKRMSLICIDEIIHNVNSDLQYWQDVKNEILKIV